MKGSISNRVDTKTLSRKKKESHLVHKESQVKAFIHHSSNLCLLIKKQGRGDIKRAMYNFEVFSNFKVHYRQNCLLPLNIESLQTRAIYFCVIATLR